MGLDLGLALYSITASSPTLKLSFSFSNYAKCLYGLVTVGSSFSKMNRVTFERFLDFNEKKNMI